MILKIISCGHLLRSSLLWWSICSKSSFSPLGCFAEFWEDLLFILYPGCKSPTWYIIWKYFSWSVALYFFSILSFGKCKFVFGEVWLTYSFYHSHFWIWGIFSPRMERFPPVAQTALLLGLWFIWSWDLYMLWCFIFHIILQISWHTRAKRTTLPLLMAFELWLKGNSLEPWCPAEELLIIGGSQGTESQFSLRAMSDRLTTNRGLLHAQVCVENTSWTLWASKTPTWSCVRGFRKRSEAWIATLCACTELSELIKYHIKNELSKAEQWWHTP